LFGPVLYSGCNIVEINYNRICPTKTAYKKAKLVWGRTGSEIYYGLKPFPYLIFVQVRKYMNFKLVLRLCDTGF